MALTSSGKGGLLSRLWLKWLPQERLADLDHGSDTTVCVRAGEHQTFLESSWKASRVTVRGWDEEGLVWRSSRQRH